MKRTLNILIVDDHDLIIEGYKSIFLNQSKYEIAIVSAHDCENASRIITENKSHFDFAIFDWILPPHEELKNGGDLVRLLYKHSSSTKSIIITSHEEAFELYNITKQINPSGLLVKSDFTTDELLLAINIINDEGVYFSETVKQSIKQINSKESYLDNYNRQIILLLSKGIKTKNMPKYLPLSISAIDKRKAQIKDYFLVNGGNDEDILREAKRFGLI